MFITHQISLQFRKWRELKRKLIRKFKRFILKDKRYDGDVNRSELLLERSFILRLAVSDENSADRIDFFRSIDERNKWNVVPQYPDTNFNYLNARNGSMKSMAIDFYLVDLILFARQNPNEMVKINTNRLKAFLMAIVSHATITYRRRICLLILPRVRRHWTVSLTILIRISKARFSHPFSIQVKCERVYFRLQSLNWKHWRISDEVKDLH